MQMLSKKYGEVPVKISDHGRAIRDLQKLLKECKNAGAEKQITVEK